MTEAYHLSYAISKQLPTASALFTDYGEFELDQEMQQAVISALTPILERRIKELSFWFQDNWYGETQEFSSLEEAEISAMKEAGTIHIYQGRNMVKSIEGEVICR